MQRKNDQARKTERLVIERLPELEELTDAGELDIENEEKWTLYWECWGEVIPRGAKEFTRSGIMDADVAHLIRVDRCEETEQIDGKLMRIIWNGARLKILAGVPTKDRKTIELHTRY